MMFEISSLEPQASEMQSILRTFLANNDLGRLTEELSRLLKNPIAVYDSNYYILANSSTKFVMDSVWQEGMKRGYCRYEYAAKLTKLAESDTPNAFQIITDVGSNRRRLQKLAIGKTTIGYFSILESTTPFENIPDDCYLFAANLLAKELSIQSSTSGETSRSRNLLLDLLNSNFANRSLFMQRIESTDLNVSGTFCLLTINMRDYSAKGFQPVQMRDVLSSLIPHSWSVYHETNIVVLISNRNTSFRFSEPCTQLQAYLSQTGLQCCISDDFTDLYLMKQHYLRCKLASQYAHIQRDVRTVIPYDDYKLIHAVNTLPSSDLTEYCSSAVLAIYEDDQANHTSNLETLYYYLHTGKSLIATSQALFVHRNTVSYRINAMSKRYHMDFSNEYETLQHYFSCILIRAKFRREL